MKTIYMDATWRRLLLWCLFSIIYYGALTAQENESAHMHEVGLQISNFDLRNFGVVYKIQRPNNENHYMRYRFLVGNIQFSTSPDNNVQNYNANVSGNVGLEKRIVWSNRIQFMHGPEAFVGFNYSSQRQDDPVSRQLGLSAGVGYILGLQYHINDQFYISVESIPGVFYRYNENKQFLTFFPSRISRNHTIGAFANSESLLLSFVCRFNKKSK
ncbi:MAG TPA: hypothetical protein PKD70_08630 [Saprospiraceae bacterium]|nr:hypothetical protein [Saprospiraceae bacterium]HMP13933.1 hypothetical protein [Saprospiraceae bacterium]